MKKILMMFTVLCSLVIVGCATAPNDEPKEQPEATQPESTESDNGGGE